jgi:hypothetical protein
MLGQDHQWTAHVRLGDGSNIQFAGDVLARIKIGTYTGNGATSLAVTDVGFTPKYLRIWERATSDATAVYVGETNTAIIDDNAAGGAVVAGTTFRDNEIISLDADGFTVDDDGADAHPNKNSSVYSYMALG